MILTTKYPILGVISRGAQEGGAPLLQLLFEVAQPP